MSGSRGRFWLYVGRLAFAVFPPTKLRAELVSFFTHSKISLVSFYLLPVPTAHVGITYSTYRQDVMFNIDDGALDEALFCVCCPTFIIIISSNAEVELPTLIVTNRSQSQWYYQLIAPPESTVILRTLLACPSLKN
jgi:hypothetical protein